MPNANNKLKHNCVSTKNVTCYMMCRSQTGVDLGDLDKLSLYNFGRELIWVRPLTGLARED